MDTKREIARDNYIQNHQYECGACLYQYKMDKRYYCSYGDKCGFPCDEITECDDWVEWRARKKS